MAIEEDIEMEKTKACLIDCQFMREQLRHKGYGSILMNIVFKCGRFKNKHVFSVSGLSHNYSATNTQGKCLFYFIFTF